MDRVRMTTKNCSEVLGSARHCSVVLGGARDCSELLESARAVLGAPETAGSACKYLTRFKLRRGRTCPEAQKVLECSAVLLYSIGRALPSTFGEHPSPTPPPPAPPCGRGAGWRRCDLRDYLPNQAPLRGWSAYSRGRIAPGRAAAGQVMVSPHPALARAFQVQTARAAGPTSRPPAAGRRIARPA